MNYSLEQLRDEFKEELSKYASDVYANDKERQLKFDRIVSCYLKFHTEAHDYIEIDMRRVAKRCDSCDYNSIKGENFFDKCDYYIWQRTKIAKWFIGVFFGCFVGLLVYIFLANSNATQKNYELLLKIDKLLSVSMKQIELNTQRLNIIEEKVFNK